MDNEGYTWYHDNVDHTPMHPHNDWVVDRCADRCDDQLPLFSRVGRGLQGDGYRVEKYVDEINQTILRGVIVDPHTGEETIDWQTGNINGGHLTYHVNINPATNPQTFTLTFTLDRPDDPDRGWTFTTPAIPYVWDDEPNTYVSSLFLKPVGAPQWEAVHPTTTPHSIEGADGTIHTIEKLVYPEDVDREDLNAPDPGDPNTVNLTYGKGGDIDCPSTDEETADIALAKSQAISTALEHLHADLGGGESLPDVTVGALKPLKGDGGSVSVWDWIEWAAGQGPQVNLAEGNGIRITTSGDTATISADIVEGDGIKITTASDGRQTVATDLAEGPGIKIATASDGKQTISADLLAGAGIQLTQNADGSITIMNSLASGTWTTLRPGVDFDWQWHNHWDGGLAQPGSNSAIDAGTTRNFPPVVRVIPSFDNHGNVIGSLVRVTAPGGIDEDTQREKALVYSGNLNDQTQFYIRHSLGYRENSNAENSWILSVDFLDSREYAQSDTRNRAWNVLNNKAVRQISGGTNNIWNVKAPNTGADPSNPGTWHHVGASWQMNCACTKTDGVGVRTFLFTAQSIADGYNSQYNTPGYEFNSTPVDYLCIVPWANFDWTVTLG